MFQCNIYKPTEIISFFSNFKIFIISGIDYTIYTDKCIDVVNLKIDGYDDYIDNKII